MGVMDERSSRIFVGVCLLVLLWIGTYWLYDPRPAGREASISFAPPETPEPEPAPEPEAEPAGAAPSSGRPSGRSSGPGPLVASGPVAPAGPVIAPAPEPAAERPAGSAEPAARVVPPAFREHVVREGESFESIARRYFGRDGLGSVVARANPLRDPRRLRPGDTVRVPLDPENIQGVVVGEGEDEPAEPGAPGADAVVEYRVRPGDTLSRIAQSYYGSVRHADFVFRANRDVLSSPDSLRVGQTLRLPPLEGPP
jgi:nucleoid-associated protein YgaU